MSIIEIKFQQVPDQAYCLKGSSLVSVQKMEDFGRSRIQGKRDRVSAQILVSFYINVVKIDQVFHQTHK